MNEIERKIAEEAWRLLPDEAKKPMALLEELYKLALIAQINLILNQRWNEV